MTTSIWILHQHWSLNYKKRDVNAEQNLKPALDLTFEYLLNNHHFPAGNDQSGFQQFLQLPEEFYYDRRDLMELCKESLTEAAKQYRTKYELSGKAREDLKKSIDLLAALRKIHVIFGEDEEATKLKNTIDAARLALEAEDKSSDKEKKAKTS